jgi:hypothetical protein
MVEAFIRHPAFDDTLCIKAKYSKSVNNPSLILPVGASVVIKPENVICLKKELLVNYN